MGESKKIPQVQQGDIITLNGAQVKITGLILLHKRLWFVPVSPADEFIIKSGAPPKDRQYFVYYFKGEPCLYSTDGIVKNKISGEPKEAFSVELVSERMPPYI